MDVFLMGATGYIGDVVAERLQQAGHQVIGLARSSATEAKLRARNIIPHRGDLQDPKALAAGAQLADATINLAQLQFDMSSDFAAQMVNMGQVVLNAVDAILTATAGTGKPFILTGGTGAYGDTGNVVATEDTPVVSVPLMQGLAEADQRVLTARDVRGMVIRPGIVYGRGGGPVSFQIQMARQHGQVTVVGDGSNSLSMVHVEDLADLYLLLLKHAPAATLLNGVAEPWVTQLDLMHAVSRAAGLGGVVHSVPLDQFGPQAYNIFSRTMRVSGARARALGWVPTQPSVIEDLDRSTAVSVVDQTA